MKNKIYLIVAVLLSLLITNDYTLFYYSWTATLLLFILSITGQLHKLPNDKPVHRQIFRPHFFAQTLFITYTCLTSIFYFLAISGFYYFDRITPDSYVNLSEITIAAKIQNYLLFAYSAYLFGMSVVRTDVRKIEYRLNIANKEHILYTSLLLNLTSQFLGLLEVFAQLGKYASSLSLLLGILYLHYAIQQKRNLLTASVYISILLLYAFATGMKESSLIIILFLFLSVYNSYKKTAIFLGLPVVIVYFLYFPTINNEYRKIKWDNETSITAFQTYEKILEEDYFNELDYEKDNWSFLTDRASEIKMYVDYFNSTPKEIPFYEFAIFESSFIGLVPRLIWPDKPSPDVFAMKRATSAGVILEEQVRTTSAKPNIFPDAYLAFGLPSIIITFFIFGLLTLKIGNWCEQKFGGYEFGTIVIFNSMFQIFNKGNCYENTVSNIVYGLIISVIIHMLMVERKYLTKVN